MFCPKCGTQNPDDARFCGDCGAELPAAGSAGPTGAGGPGAPTPQAAGGGAAVSKEMNIGIIIASIFIPLVGIIMGIIYMIDPNPAKKSAGRVWLMVAIGAIVLYCVLGVLAGLGGY